MGNCLFLYLKRRGPMGGDYYGFVGVSCEGILLFRC